MRGVRESDGQGPGPVVAKGGLGSTGDLIVMSRLLVLQSRRILLTSCLNKMRATGNEFLRPRAVELQKNIERAHSDYRKAVLAWASPDTAQYWLVAHQTMIEGAEDLVTCLHDSADELPQPDRGEIDADIVRLQEIIERWRESMVTSMGGSRAKAI